MSFQQGAKPCKEESVDPDFNPFRSLQDQNSSARASIQSNQSQKRQQLGRQTSSSVLSRKSDFSKKKVALSSEDLQLLEIQRKREEKQKQKERQSKFYSKMINQPTKPASKIPVRQPTQAKGFKLKTEQANQRQKLDQMLQQKSNCAMKTKASDEKRFKSGPTVPQPFALSKSRRPETESKPQAEGEFVPLKIRVENFFAKETFCSKRAQKKQNDDEATPVKLTESGSKLTIAKEPLLLSQERSKFKQKETKTSEDIILEDMERKAFKALPLNRRLFEKKDSPPREVVHKPTTFQEFNLSMPRKRTDFENDEQLQTQFVALPLNKKIFEPKVYERYSAPPKMTKPEGFDFKTDLRAQQPRVRLEIKAQPKQFKAREMPCYPEPQSPQKSSKNFFDFKEFNLSQPVFKERKSCPPLKQPEQYKAREMPDFTKLEFRPAESNKTLTIPEGFQLQSLQRHQQARDAWKESLKQEQEEDQNRRVFKSKPLPDSKEMVVMPSLKPITLAVSPNFASDLLPKKPRQEPQPTKNTDSPKDFEF